MITISEADVKYGRGNYSDEIYVFYGVAKKAGIRRGTQFKVDAPHGMMDDIIFEAVEYITWRPDISRSFKGFRCVEKK